MSDLLQQAHALNVPWTESPFFPAMLEQAELDSELKEMARFFSEHGYVIFDPKIPDAWLDGAAKDLDGRFVPGNPSYYSDERRVQDAWWFADHVKKIANAPRVLEVLEMLYRRKPFAFQTLNFRIGSEQKTHSDTAFFDSVPHKFMCGVWVALEDVDESNGPLHYYPKSHRQVAPFNVYDLGLMGTRHGDNPLNQIGRYEEFVQALMPASGLQRTELKIQRGQALIWAANLYHGGCPILDKARTRLTQVTHYYFEGCLYYTPLGSDPGIGRLLARKVCNASDGREMPQFYNGHLVANPGEWPPRLADEVERALESKSTPEPERKTFDLLRRTLAALRVR
jgi:Phytanoyl-CoA dioxygenase (PhyH)